MPTRRLAALLVAVLSLVAVVAVVPGAAGGAGAAPRQEPTTVYAVDPLSGKLKVKPRKLAFRDLQMTDLRWRRWGQPVARARGISRILTCEPNCGSGGAVTTATTVKLSRIRERGGRLRYTCMSWRDDEKVSDLPASGSLNPATLRPCRAPRASAAARCRGIALGYTTAKVTARGMRCRKARFVILAWKRKAGEDDGPPPAHSRALGFDCHFGGSDLLITLRCTRGERVAKATWGG